MQQLSLVVTLSLVLLVQSTSAQVNYTCLAAVTISSSASQASSVGSCLQTAATSSLSVTSVKSCLKSTKTKEKTAKKPTKLFYKCLATFWKAVAAIAKKSSAITSSVQQCLKTYGSYAQCKLASLVGTSNAKLTARATKADAKWDGKKCAGVLTPSGCGIAASTTPALSTGTTSSSSNSSVSTTTGSSISTTSSSGSSTAITTTTAVTASTTAPDPCLTNYCLTQCLVPTCTADMATAANGTYYGAPQNKFECDTNGPQVPVPEPTDPGNNKTEYLSVNLGSLCKNYVFVISPDYQNSTYSSQTRSDSTFICNPGDRAWLMLAGSVYESDTNITALTCLQTYE